MRHILLFPSFIRQRISWGTFDGMSPSKCLLMIILYIITPSFPSHSVPAGVTVSVLSGFAAHVISLTSMTGSVHPPGLADHLDTLLVCKLVGLAFTWVARLPVVKPHSLPPTVIPLISASTRQA